MSVVEQHDDARAQASRPPPAQLPRRTHVSATATTSTGGSRSSRSSRSTSSTRRPEPAPRQSRTRPSAHARRDHAAPAVDLGINHEQAIQDWALGWRPLIIAANYFYGSLHFIVTGGVMIYLYRKWSDDYPLLAQHARASAPGSRSSASRSSRSCRRACSTASATATRACRATTASSTRWPRTRRSGRSTRAR